MAKRCVVGKSAIDRLSKVAGVARLSSIAHDNVREALYHWIKDKMYGIVVVMETLRKETVSDDIVLGEVGLLFFDQEPTIPRAVFGRLVREIGRDFRNCIRYEEQALTHLQHAAERYIINLFGVAKHLVNHCDRSTVLAKDIQFALRIMDCKL